MSFGHGLQVFGDGSNRPALDKRYGWLDNWPYMLYEPYQGPFSFPTHQFLLYSADTLRKDFQSMLIHKPPITEK
jgi:hypothetical protein